MLIGEQYVRGLGWRWVTWREDEADVIIAVIDQPGLAGNRPIVWLDRLLRDADVEIAIELNYAMVEADTHPTGSVDQPLMVE